MAAKSGKDRIRDVTDAFSQLSLEERERRAVEAISELEKEMRVLKFIFLFMLITDSAWGSLRAPTLKFKNNSDFIVRCAVRQCFNRIVNYLDDFLFNR